MMMIMKVYCMRFDIKLFSKFKKKKEEEEQKKKVHQKFTQYSIFKTISFFLFNGKKWCTVPDARDALRHVEQLLRMLLFELPPPPQKKKMHA